MSNNNNNNTKGKRPVDWIHSTGSDQPKHNLKITTDWLGRKTWEVDKTTTASSPIVSQCSHTSTRTDRNGNPIDHHSAFL